MAKKEHKMVTMHATIGVLSGLLLISIVFNILQAAEPKIFENSTEESGY